MTSQASRDRQYALLCGLIGVLVASALIIVPGVAFGSSSIMSSFFELLSSPPVCWFSVLAILAYCFFYGAAAGARVRKPGGFMSGPLFALSSLAVGLAAGGLFEIVQVGARLTLDMVKSAWFWVYLILMVGSLPAFLLGCLFSRFVLRDILLVREKVQR